MITLSRHIFLCRDNIMFIPQTCMSQRRYPCPTQFQCSFCKLVSRPSFSCCDSISIMVLVATLSCILSSRSRPKKPIATEFCRHFIFLLQLHFLCCDLDFCVGDVLHVATPICYVATTLFCMQHIFLSRLNFFGHDITFLPSACLRVATHFSYRDRTFLCSADFCVVT